MRVCENTKRQENNDEKLNDKAIRTLVSVLNKVTTDNLNKLLQDVTSLPIVSDSDIELASLEKKIDIIIKKGIREPKFSHLYADVCKEIIDVELKSIADDIDAASTSDAPVESATSCISNSRLDQSLFYRVLMRKIEHEIDSRDDYIAAVVNILNNKSTAYNFRVEESTKIRRDMIGVLRLISLLYLRDIISSSFIFNIATRLITEKEIPADEDIEDMCKLISLIGAKLQNEEGECLAKIIDILKSLLSTPVQNEPSSSNNNSRHRKLPVRIKFKIQDLFDLMESQWIPKTKAWEVIFTDDDKRTADQYRRSEEQTRLARYARTPDPSFRIV